MPQIERSALVFYSAQQMFDLVNAVPDYPQFLPGCNSARIVSQSETEMVASLNVSKAGIGHSFTTRNTLYPNQRIVMQLVDGPFKQLQGGWEFQPLSDTACKVILKLDFEFSNKLVQFAFGKIFAELTTSMVSAFTQRAKQVYGVNNG
ncbi:MAG: SRPBCC family protein [Gammaproteobacteria bacterium]|nr:SRPBCC family protein [Gammaproteobacteria bacterium]MBU1555532.1 SRPBCC family protein [Gammaproteobacteria bacterium]MBU2072124.1 SRPBCC family protein [Gammaproteobacteria bacterium]MBU2181600.1 SRPBCC family protein [Gammaproteobacteria bacterium]MBU2203455.1 SRPBCC family protein [Gammaproteobacteria bacterium]